MNDKKKTLLYFLCFIAACLLYYSIIQLNWFENPAKSKSSAPTDITVLEDLRKTQDKPIKE